MMTDTGAKPYKCQLCQKSFAKLSDLELHVRTHTQDKPYGCQLCEKSFCYSSSLKVHMRTHTGEKPHVCQVCEKSFFDRSGLRKHSLRLHTGEKSYIHCDLCQISFPFHSQMKKHMEIHNGEKSYIFEGLKKIENFGKHGRIHGTEKQQSLNDTITKRCPTADQFKPHADTQPQDLKIGSEVIAKGSDRFIAFSSTGVIDSPNEDFSKNKYTDSSGNAGQLQIVNDEECLYNGKVKSSVDKKASFSTTFGCGICDKLLDREKDFLEHCSSHQFSPPIAW